MNMYIFYVYAPECYMIRQNMRWNIKNTIQVRLMINLSFFSCCNIHL